LCSVQVSTIKLGTYGYGDSGGLERGWIVLDSNGFEKRGETVNSNSFGL